jgi:hypothetical protein
MTEREKAALRNRVGRVRLELAGGYKAVEVTERALERGDGVRWKRPRRRLIILCPEQTCADEGCETLFRPRSSQQRFCSDRCQASAKRRRKREMRKIARAA